ncbi:MAG TPA: hypothetical protein VM901_06860 [Bdellovibrionota bacterium]|jgi:hypothetical protein|nr:hypothetical protein [Bdellovibrionota bacterium]
MGLSTLVNASVIATTLLFLSACGQDRNLSDYRSSLVELELSKYRSIAGTYRGLAYQAGSKKPLGEIEVQLLAATVVDTDGLRREPRAVLQSYIRLRVPNLSEIVASMETGYYLPVEKRLKTSVNATRNGGSTGTNAPGGGAPTGSGDVTRTVQLEADVDGKTLTGLLAVFGYTNTGLEIEVERDAEWPALNERSFAKDRLPYISARGRISYSGKAFYADGRKEPAKLELRNNSLTSIGMLIDILSPVRIFTGIVDLPGTKMRFSFSNMAWDSEAGTLKGSQQRGGLDAIVISTECTEHTDAKTEGWNCTYTSTMGGILQEFTFRRPLNAAEESQP